MISRHELEYWAQVSTLTIDGFALYCRTAIQIRTLDQGYVPFILTEEQTKLAEHVLNGYRNKQQVRVIVLKNRRLGISSVMAALSIYLGAFVKGFKTLCVAHHARATATIAGIALQMNSSLVPHVKARTGAAIKANGLVWPLAWGSDLKIQTARNDHAARGSGVDMLWCSEVASFDYSRASTTAEDSLTSLLGSLEGVGTIAVFESTANGVNSFHDRWVQAENNPTGPWTPMFFPWYQSKKLTFPQTEQELAAWEKSQQHKAEGNLWDAAVALEGNGLDEYWVDQSIEYGLTIPQCKWAMTKIADFGGDINRFHTEFPLSSRHCFISSGSPVIQDSILSTIPIADEYIESGPLTIDGVDNTTVDVSHVVDAYSSAGNRPTYSDLETPGKEWRFYEDILPDFADKYVVGADIAGGTGKDRTAIVVLNRKTMSVAAEYYCSTTLPEDAATQLFLAGYLFGFRKQSALVIPERNNHGGVVLKRLDDMGYPNIYRSQAPTSNSTTNTYQRTLGFDQTAKTRPLILTDLMSQIRKGSLIVRSSRLKQELSSFVNIDGRMDHAKGHHDDLIMALALALHGHRYLGDVDPQQKVDRVNPMDRMGRPVTFR